MGKRQWERREGVERSAYRDCRGNRTRRESKVMMRDGNVARIEHMDVDGVSEAEGGGWERNAPKFLAPCVSFCDSDRR